MKILDTPATDIPLKDLPPGKIAQITRWAGSSAYEGKLVQYLPLFDILVEVGEDSYLKGAERLKEYGDVRVRVLPRGTTLQI